MLKLTISFSYIEVDGRPWGGSRQRGQCCVASQKHGENSFSQKTFILSIFQRITHLAMSHSYPYQVGPDEVDEELHDEIQQECGKYGKVENVVIYQVAQALQ